MAAGARTLNIPDTVGYTTPGEIRALFEYLRANVRGADKRGLQRALPQRPGPGRRQLAGRHRRRRAPGRMHDQRHRRARRQLRAGGTGDGAERARRLLRRATPASTRAGWCPPRACSRASPACQVQRNKAIVGLNAFAHESGIHQHGMLKHRGTYEIMRPAGRGLGSSRRWCWAATAAAPRWPTACASWASCWRRRNSTRCSPASRRWPRRSARSSTRDLEALVLGADARVARGHRLARLHVSTGVGAATACRPPACDLVRSPTARRSDEAAVGDGPVACAVRGAGAGHRRGPGARELPGAPASPPATTRRAKPASRARVDGVELTGSGTSTDILEASALAWLDVANRVLRAQPSGGSAPVAGRLAREGGLARRHRALPHPTLPQRDKARTDRTQPMTNPEPCSTNSGTRTSSRPKATPRRPCSTSTCT